MADITAHTAAIHPHHMDMVHTDHTAAFLQHMGGRMDHMVIHLHMGHIAATADIHHHMDTVHMDHMAAIPCRHMDTALTDHMVDTPHHMDMEQLVD